MADKVFDPKAPLIVNCGEIDGFREYTGRFVFKRPNNRDNLAIAVRNAKLTDGQDLDVGYSNAAWVLATLEIVLTEKPPTVVFADLYDMQPVFQLYERYVKWESSFRLVVQGKQEQTS